MSGSSMMTFLPASSILIFCLAAEGARAFSDALGGLFIKIAFVWCAGLAGAIVVAELAFLVGLGWSTLGLGTVVRGALVGASASFVDAPHPFAPTMPGAFAPIVRFVGSVNSLDVGTFDPNGLIVLPGSCHFLVLGSTLVRALEFFQEGVEDDEVLVLFFGFGLPFLHGAQLVVFDFDFEHELLAMGEVSFSVLRLEVLDVLLEERDFGRFIGFEEPSVRDLPTAVRVSILRYRFWR
jgi:hypothetical protein